MSPRTATAALVLDAVERYGVLLVHDGALDCVTSLVTGGPVAGSWWSHPRANEIYNALGEIEDDVAVVKLLRGKQTLVARRLWPDVAAVGASRASWQLRRVAPEALSLLDQVEAAGAPFLPGRQHAAAAGILERRLLLVTTDVHTDAGRHVKALESWRHWAAGRGVGRAPDLAQAYERLTRAAAETAPDPGGLLPWPSAPHAR